MTIPTAADPPRRHGRTRKKGVMPSLLDLDLLPSPLVDPLSYPGAALRHSFLWLDSWVYRVEPDRGVRAVGVAHRDRRRAAGGWRRRRSARRRAAGGGRHADGRPASGAGLRLQRLPGAAADQVRGAESGAPGRSGAPRSGGRAGVGPFAARQHPRLRAVRDRRRRRRCRPGRVRAVVGPGATRRAGPDRAELPAGADARGAVSAARGSAAHDRGVQRLQGKMGRAAVAGRDGAGARCDAARGVRQARAGTVVRGQARAR